MWFDFKKYSLFYTTFNFLVMWNPVKAPVCGEFISCFLFLCLDNFEWNGNSGIRASVIN